MTLAADPTNGAFYARPTLAMRVARALGYRFHLGEEPADIEGLPGLAKSEIRLRLSFLDRIRLLVTGKLDISLTHYADQQMTTQRNRVDLRFPAPWE